MKGLINSVSKNLEAIDETIRGASPYATRKEKAAIASRGTADWHLKKAQHHQMRGDHYEDEAGEHDKDTGPYDRKLAAAKRHWDKAQEHRAEAKKLGADRDESGHPL
jgi:hypothetical protein